MRVLFVIQPAISNLHTVAPAALALQEAGHDVQVAAGASFGEETTSLGLAHVSAGVDMNVASDPSNWPDFIPVPSPDTDMGEFLVQMLGTLAEHAVPDLLAVARDWCPDLMVRVETEHATPIVAQLLDIPHVSIGSDGHSAMDDPACAHPSGNRALSTERTAQLRAKFGLLPDPADTLSDGYLHLCFNAPEWAESGIGQPPNTRFLRFEPTVPPGPPRPLPDWFTALPSDRPTVLAALGTIFHRTPGLLDAIIDGLADEPVNLLVAIGKDADPAQFNPPPNVRLEPFVPQARILPHCDLFLSHGGYNSVRESLHAAVPMVITPITTDQPHNARRCQTLGCALTVSPDDLTSQTIRDAASLVLTDPSYKAAAERFSARMRNQPGHDQMIDLFHKIIER